MKNSMLKLSTLSAAVLSASTAMAGGFDNSDRSLDILFGDDNVITTSYGQTSVPMKATVQQGAVVTNTVSSGEIVGDFTRPTVAFRYNITEDLTCATKYEQPYAASVAYQDDNMAYEHPLSSSDSITAPISTKYESESVTVACGYDFALPTGQLKVYGGPRIQEVKGAFDEDLSHLATGADDNLEVALDGGAEVGYVVGAAYSIPEIALRASLTYHSQVDYDAKGTVSAPLAGVGSFTTSATAKTFTPQSVEIALQSGIAENTLASVTMRWSEYSKLEDLQVTGDESTVVGGVTLAQIIQANAQADALINPGVDMFSNDTFDYELGLGRRFSDQLSLGASFSGSIKLGGKDSDTPLGADSTSLRLPGDTSHTLSFGGEYSVIPGLKVNGGFGYTFINAYVVQEKTNSLTGVSDFKAEFSKTEATSFQMGVSYEI